MNTNFGFIASQLEFTIENVLKNSDIYMTNMNNLEQNYETITNSYMGNYLNLTSVVSILFAISVIVSKNPVVSVLFLIGLFFSIACYLMLIGITFIGLSYLLVYVGAVSILFLFILMLINVRISDLMTNNTNSIPLVLIIAMFFSYPLQQILPNSSTYFTNVTYNALHVNDNKLLFGFNNYWNYSLLDDNINFYVTSKMWDGYLTEMTHITSIGNIMYSNYSMWLILTSIILLLAMIGAIVITVKNTNADLKDSKNNVTSKGIN